MPSPLVVGIVLTLPISLLLSRMWKRLRPARAGKRGIISMEIESQAS